MLGNVTLVPDTLHQLPQTLVVCRELIIPGSEHQRPRGPRHTQRFEEKPRSDGNGEVEPDNLLLRLHPARLEAGQSLIDGLRATPTKLQELEDTASGRLHCESSVPALEAPEKDDESCLLGPGDWVQAPISELRDGHLAHEVARRAPEPLGDGGSLELREQLRTG